MATHLDVSNDLTDEQKKVLSDKIEVLMGKYGRMIGQLELDGHNTAYLNGVMDGLNNAYKLVNEIEDDYCILE